jgi:RNA polymerase sigma-70 factor, ECF subfamily
MNAVTENTAEGPTSMTPVRAAAKSALRCTSDWPRVGYVVGDISNSDELIRRAQEGDVHAFELLVEAQIPRLRRFARSFAHSDADADDLAQEALIKVYRSLRSYRFESAFTTWLYRVTKNCFMDTQRAADSRARATERLEASAPPQPPVDPPDELLRKAEERELLWNAIAQVAPEFRTAIVLCDVEGLGIGEVAQIEKIPEGTVKSRLHRGRAQLARLLQDSTSAGNQASTAAVLPMEGMDVS